LKPSERGVIYGASAVSGDGSDSSDSCDKQGRAVSSGRPEEDRVLASVEVYSANADAYERAYAERYAEIVQRFAQRLSQGSSVLDAGCGPGRDLERFVRVGLDARGVDLSPEFVARARAYAPARCGDLRSLGALFPARSFDGVWASASLVHLSTDEVVAVLEHFAVLLRDGGSLFLSVKSSGVTGWLDEADGRRWYRVWRPEEIAALVVAAGFVVEEAVDRGYVELWATRRG